MKQYGTALERISGIIRDNTAALPGQPVVELVGDRRVLIENHIGVTEYGTERICVKVKYGQLSVCGYGLELVRMTKAQLVITGNIGSITIDRRERT